MKEIGRADSHQIKTELAKKWTSSEGIRRGYGEVVIT